MATVTNFNAGGRIAARRDFKNATGSFSGYARSAPQAFLGYLGHLPQRWRAADLERADYVVYSYSTPIAWHIPGEGWHVPEVSYSSTTNKHQSITRSAVWDDLAVKPTWITIPESNAAARILRSIRTGYAVSARGRSRRVLDLVLATGEAVRDGDSLVPVDGSHIRSEA
jgi:hypothetical protein